LGPAQPPKPIGRTVDKAVASQKPESFMMPDGKNQPPKPFGEPIDRMQQGPDGNLMQEEANKGNPHGRPIDAINKGPDGNITGGEYGA